jgi:hypothetical protein
LKAPEGESWQDWRQCRYKYIICKEKHFHSVII